MTINLTKIVTLTLNDSSENGTDDDTSTNVYSSIIIIPIILLAVIGNSLTILCFARDKGLHKTCNVYILNLAICDLLIGAITMPIYLTFTFNNNVWLFGYHFCKAFLVFDFATSGVTVILMILISYDRLSLLKHWSTYHKTHSPKKAYIKCALAWLYLIILNTPATIGWDIWNDNVTIDTTDCDATYKDNGIYISIMTFIQFVIPLTILIIIHIVIVKEIRKLIMAREELTYIPSHSGSMDSTNSMLQLHLIHNSCSRIRIHEDIKTRKTTKSTKAAKSLAILTGVFIFTWAPYACVLVVRSFCPSCSSVLATETATWLLWSKSAVNPFLYAFNSNRFRENFKYFLFCQRRGYKPTASS